MIKKDLLTQNVRQYDKIAIRALVLELRKIV